MAGRASRHKLLDRTFWVGLMLKGLDGVLELAGGVLLLFVSPTQINELTRLLTQREIDEDPNDLIDTYLRDFTSHLSVSTTVFGAIYLLVHGVVKIVLVWAVLRGYVKAYPWMIAFLIAFIVFQGYEMIQHFSVGLALLTAFDIFITYLTWREYGIKKIEKAKSLPTAVPPP